MNTTTDPIFNFLKEAVLELKDIEPGGIVPETEIAGLGLDSLDLVEIQVNIRREYGVQVPPDIFASGEVQTLAQLAGHIALKALAAEPLDQAPA